MHPSPELTAAVARALQEPRGVERLAAALIAGFKLDPTTAATAVSSYLDTLYLQLASGVAAVGPDAVAAVCNAFPGVAP